MRLREKPVMLTWISGLLYIVLSVTLPAFQMIYVDELPFTLTIWVATVASVATLSYAWTAYVLDADTKLRLLAGYLVVVVSIFLFYLEPILYGGSLVGALEAIAPATAAAIESLSTLPSTHLFALYWCLTFFTPLILLRLLLFRLARS